MIEEREDGYKEGMGMSACGTIVYPGGAHFGEHHDQAGIKEGSTCLDCACIRQGVLPTLGIFDINTAYFTRSLALQKGVTKRL